MTPVKCFKFFYFVVSFILESSCVVQLMNTYLSRSMYNRNIQIGGSAKSILSYLTTYLGLLNTFLIII